MKIDCNNIHSTLSFFLNFLFYPFVLFIYLFFLFPTMINKSHPLRFKTNVRYNVIFYAFSAVQLQ